MKKKIILLSAMLLAVMSTNSYAQDYWFNTATTPTPSTVNTYTKGNVGIGSTSEPSTAKLQIDNYIAGPGPFIPEIQINRYNSALPGGGTSPLIPNYFEIWNYPPLIHPSPILVDVIDNQGWLGILTPKPSMPLDVNGTAIIEGGLLSMKMPVDNWRSIQAQSNKQGISVAANTYSGDGASIELWGANSGYPGHIHYFSNSQFAGGDNVGHVFYDCPSVGIQNPLMYIYRDGSAEVINNFTVDNNATVLGIAMIGTSTPSAGAALTVNNGDANVLNGNVNIGNLTVPASPGGILNVARDGNIGGNLTVGTGTIPVTGGNLTVLNNANVYNDLQVGLTGTTGTVPGGNLNVINNATINGNVTIGTIAPSTSGAALTVGGDAQLENNAYVWANAYVQGGTVDMTMPTDGSFRTIQANSATAGLNITAGGPIGPGASIQLNGMSSSSPGAVLLGSYSTGTTPDNGFTFFSNTASTATPLMHIYNSGQVAIGSNLIPFGSDGTQTFPSGSKRLPPGYSLYVANGILTEKLKVANSGDPGNWSDFVFNKDYNLMPLSKVASYVKTNKHLPEIPSADEVAKEGIDVASMDAKLLQKIEELTLYVIQQQKEIDELKQQQKN